MTELELVLTAYQLYDRDLTDAEVSEIVEIQPKNIPRSRIKLWYMGYLTTDDFISFHISPSGRQQRARDIKFSDDFREAISKFRRAKATHCRGSNQQVLFDED